MSGNSRGLGQNRSKIAKKNRKIENLRIFGYYIFHEVMEFQILLQSVNKQKSLIEKTFGKFEFQILIFDEPRQFLARMLKSRYENPENSGKFQKSPSSPGLGLIQKRSGFLQLLFQNP